jgi:condensin complex subunit 2
LDEAFWAQQKAPEDAASPEGDYDANFFQDDDGLPFPGGDDPDDDDLEFSDAREHLSPGAEGDMGLTEGVGMTAMLNGDTMNTMGAFGTTLVTQTRRVRPEYVQFARVAKKVDVRRLKEEIWKGMGLEELEVCVQCSLIHYKATAMQLPATILTTSSHRRPPHRRPTRKKNPSSNSPK